MKSVFSYILSLFIISLFFGFGSSLHATAATEILQGDVIQGFGSHSVYYLDDEGVRHPFPNDRTYFTWYEDFSGIKRVPLAALSQYPLGDPIRYRAGTRLIKVQTDARVYAVDYGGVLRWITSEQIAETLYGKNWSKLIDDLPDVFFPFYKRGEDITTFLHPNGSLIRYSFQPDTVYLIEDNLKRHVQSENAFRANHFQWRFVHVVSSPDVHYDNGVPLIALEEELTDPSQLTLFGRHRAPYSIIQEIPDINQPPTNLLGMGITDNFSVPSAAASILKYWEKEERHPSATLVTAGLSDKALAEYLGYFLDANNKGSSSRMNSGTLGSLASDIEPGVREFVLWDGGYPTSYGFPTPRALSQKRSYNSWKVETTLSNTKSNQEGFLQLKRTIISGTPLLVVFEHWNIQRLGEYANNVPLYDWAAPLSINDDGGKRGIPFETWTVASPREKSSGHGTVAVGFIEDFDMNGSIQDWVIVHDTWAGTPSLLAIPWDYWLSSTSIVPGENQAPSGFVSLAVDKGSVGRGESIRLSWTSARGAKYYEIQKGTSINFYSPETYRRDGSNTYWDTVPRVSGSDTVYYRVRAANELGTTAWSNYVSVNVTTLTGTRLSITGNRNVLVSGETARLRWSKLSGATGYHVQIDTTSAFSNPQTQSRDNAFDYYDFTAPNVTQSVQYYFRVRAYDRFGNGPWSNIVQIEATRSPAQETLNLRGPSEVFSGQTFTISWVAISGATSYQVQKSLSSSFGGANTFVLPPTALQYEDTQAATVRMSVYYRVRADFGARQGNWSNVLTIAVKPHAPQLQGPTGAVSGRSFALSWNSLSGSTGYHFQYATQASFSGATTVTLAPEMNEYNFTPPLFTNTYYYFRVRGFTGAGNGEWSNTITTYVQADNAPLLQGPPENARNGQPFTVSWNAIAGAEGYHIQVDTQSTFSSANIFLNPANAVTFTYIPDAPTGRYFYVRVRAYGQYGEGDWSNVLNIFVSP